MTEPLPDRGNVNATDRNDDISYKMAEDYLVRHVVPEALSEVKKEIIGSVKEIIEQDKIRILSIPSESEQIMQEFSTYGGLLRSLADLTNEKFGAAGQKVLIPAVVIMIKKFMKEKGLNEESLMGSRHNTANKIYNGSTLSGKVKSRCNNTSNFRKFTGCIR